MYEKSLTTTNLEQKVTAARLEGILEGVGRHWLAGTNLLWGILNGLPWLAPILMQLGAVGWAKVIYAFYSLLCHQLADRSFFLFGAKWMYSYTELLPYTSDVPSSLMAFIGNPELGYKVAWSDRMVSLYGGILLGGIAFALLRRWLKPLKLTRALLLIAPIVIDGGTHMLSDLGGLTRGFRYDNAWLAYLTGYRFARGFYIGNALGSFNSSMRLITGLLAGLAITWLVYPLLDGALRDQAPG
jgi:uncharacterized membrane protein